MVNNTEASEKDLILKAKSGDAAAFSELIKSYENRLARVACIMIPGEYEDVLQETFISAFRSIKTFKGRSAFYTWLYRILLNHIYRRYRKHKKKSTLLEKMNRRQEHSHVQDSINREETLIIKEKVRKAIRTLQPKYQEVVLLYYFEDKSLKDISKTLELKEGTVKSRLFKARQTLSVILSEPAD